MNISKKGVELLKEYESLKLMPYDDQNPKEKLENWNERATIGYGHLIIKTEWIKFKDGITKEEAADLKAKDLSMYIYIVNKYVKPELNQNQFDALVIFSYNIGPGAFKRSTALKIINDPNYTSVYYPTLESAWKAFNKDRHPVTGKKFVSNGLVNRRKKEWNLYNGK